MELPPYNRFFVFVAKWNVLGSSVSDTVAAVQSSEWVRVDLLAYPETSLTTETHICLSLLAKVGIKVGFPNS
jgi:hypothetical protein